MPLVVLVTKFGGGLPVGMLQANSSATTLSVALAIKFDGGLPTRMLLVDGGAKDAFGGPDHQVWWRAPCGDAAG